MIREFEIACPCCRGWIVLDLETGTILDHGREGEIRGKKVTKPKQLEDAFDRLKEREKGGDALFKDAVRSVEKSKQKLDDAFEEAKKKAAKRPDEKPRNPFDEMFE